MSATGRLRVGLLGYGTVARALARMLAEERERFARDLGVDVALAAVGTRKGEAARDASAPEGVRFTADLSSVVSDPTVDAVVELIGGTEPARTLVLAAFRGGRSVVTANKLMLARHGTEIVAAAAARGLGLGLEAAVAGGIPILRALRESFVGDRVDSVAGILNGTCNFILTEMERTSGDYGAILAQAQRLGYAETDPVSDVGGDDAACKLTLLARMAFGQDVPVEAVACEGITGLLPCDFVYARQLGRTLRQIGQGTRLPDGRLVLSVRTHLVSGSSLLAKVNGPFNAVLVRLARGGDFVFSGRGAGGDPTATAVLADVLELARSGPRPLVPPLAFPRLAPFAPAGPADFSAPYYLRFVVKDAPGILASIAQALAAHGANIDAVFQAPLGDKSALPFVITLEKATEAQVAAAMADVARLPFHALPPLALPMTG